MKVSSVECVSRMNVGCFEGRRLCTLWVIMMSLVAMLFGLYEFRLWGRFDMKCGVIMV